MSLQAAIAAHVPTWAILDIARHPQDFKVRRCHGTVKVTDKIEAVYYYRGQCIEQDATLAPWHRWGTTHRVLPMHASTLREIRCQIDKRYPVQKAA